MAIEQIVSHFGYAAVVGGTFLEGETILLAAGFAAHQGYLKLPWVILGAFAGSFAGDQLYFFLGRLKGRQFLEQRPAWRAKVTKVDRLVDSHATWIMLGFRFMYGLRTITPLVIGSGGFSLSRFITLNAAGALVWAVTVSCLGFLCGAAAQTALTNVRKVEDWILLAMLGVGAIVWAVYFLRKGRRGTKEGTGR